MDKLTYLDQQLFQWIVKQTTRRYHDELMLLFKSISKTGDGHLYFVLAILLFSFEEEDGVIFFYTALLAYIFEIPIYVILKRVFKRRRPTALFSDVSTVITPSDKFSLPSGHTAAAFLMATVIGEFYPSLVPFVFAWASLVGLSRVVLRVHFPLDVLIGMSLGICFALISINILG